jgi:hypothetical protein
VSVTNWQFRDGVAKSITRSPTRARPTGSFGTDHAAGEPGSLRQIALRSSLPSYYVPSIARSDLPLRTPASRLVPPRPLPAHRRATPPEASTSSTWHVTSPGEYGSKTSLKVRSPVRRHPQSGTESNVTRGATESSTFSYYLWKTPPTSPMSASSPRRRGRGTDDGTPRRRRSGTSPQELTDLDEMK